MKQVKTLYLIALMWLFAACGEGAAPPKAADTPVAATPIDTSLPDPNPLPEEVDEVPANEPVAVADAAPTKQAAPQKRETLYISTHAAQGEVYGTVTMTGDKGRGTIHDEHENTLAITVTRHGSELFGVDQNGRQYVFRL